MALGAAMTPSRPPPGFLGVLAGLTGVDTASLMRCPIKKMEGWLINDYQPVQHRPAGTERIGGEISAASQASNVRSRRTISVDGNVVNRWTTAETAIFRILGGVS